MPGIEFLKDWDPKKHGWPALLVTVIWVLYELTTTLLVQKDPSCMQEVKYFQNEATVANQSLRDLTKALILKDLELEKYKKNDSAYHKVISPYKQILKKK